MERDVWGGEANPEIEISSEFIDDHLGPAIGEKIFGADVYNQLLDNEYADKPQITDAELLKKFANFQSGVRKSTTLENFKNFIEQNYPGNEVTDDDVDKAKAMFMDHRADDLQA